MVGREGLKIMAGARALRGNTGQELTYVEKSWPCGWPKGTFFFITERKKEVWL